jgi:hypothetical protein
MEELMRQPDATTARIILVFARRFGLALLLAAAACDIAAAQGGYSLRMTLDYQGRSYSVEPTHVAADQRTELTVEPVGGLRVYVRAISLPGVADQALIDMQVYEPRGSSQAQISSFTMPAYLGTSNSSEMKTVYGPLTIRAYVDQANAAAGAAPPRPATPSMRAPTPMVDEAPVRPQALPAPLPSPLPPPGG